MHACVRLYLDVRDTTLACGVLIACIVGFVYIYLCWETNGTEGWRAALRDESAIIIVPSATHCAMHERKMYLYDVKLAAEARPRSCGAYGCCVGVAPLLET